MNKVLTWLHLSDIHFHGKDEPRIRQIRTELLDYLRDTFAAEGEIRPDLIFCTGDIAYGQNKGHGLPRQYHLATEFFDELLYLCGRGGRPLPKERLFVVPGNHDVNRDKIDAWKQSALTQKAQMAYENEPHVNERFERFHPEIVDAMRRLDEYVDFVKSYLPHQVDPDGRACYTRRVNINDIELAISGFNSAWSCAGPDDDSTIWLGATAQFTAAKQMGADAILKIGLMHQPASHLNPAERKLAEKYTAEGFDFWLHGHEHDAWVDVRKTHVEIAAGAIGAKSKTEFIINITQADLRQRTGKVLLHRYSNGWMISPVPTHAPRGYWPFKFPERIPELPT